MLGKSEALRLLIACRPLAGKLVQLGNFTNYRLSQPELEAVKGYGQVCEVFDYTGLMELAEQADLKPVERVCLASLYAIVCVRRVHHLDEATGERPNPRTIYQLYQTDYQIL